VTTPLRTPIQIPLPLVDKPKGKIDLLRQGELITVLAELLLLAVHHAPERPDEHKEVGDEAR